MAMPVNILLGTIGVDCASSSLLDMESVKTYGAGDSGYEDCCNVPAGSTVVSGEGSAHSRADIKSAAILDVVSPMLSAGEGGQMKAYSCLRA
jgi:hypothetical protein